MTILFGLFLFGVGAVTGAFVVFLRVLWDASKIFDDTNCGV